MARQTHPLIWVKTYGIVSFYERCGMGYVRMKSNLTGERWRSDPAFEGSRRSAACMAISSKLASTFYKTIPEPHRYYPHYKQLVGVAQHMLCAGYSIKQVNKVLHFTIGLYLRKQLAADPANKPLRSPFAATLSLKAVSVTATALLPQFTSDQFVAITVDVPAHIWPVIISSRGSPAVIAGCTNGKQEPISAEACYVYSAGYNSCKGYSQWRESICPYLSNKAVLSSEPHQNAEKTAMSSVFKTCTSSRVL